MHILICCFIFFLINNRTFKLVFLKSTTTKSLFYSFSLQSFLSLTAFSSVQFGLSVIFDFFFFSNPKEVKSLSLKYICTLMFIAVLFRITKVWKQPKYCWLFSHSVMSDFLQPHGLQHTRFPCPSPSPRVCWNSCPLSQWYYPTISSSVISLFSWLQSLPASGFFPLSQFFASGGQRIRVLDSASVLPVNIQDWLPLGLTGLISLLSKRLSRVFSDTTVKKYQFFGTQLSLWSSSHIHTWLLEKP